jgi:hypothetical protein
MLATAADIERSDFTVTSGRNITILKLSWVGNPDLQQFADVAEPRMLEVGSFAKASEKTLEYIREWNLGGGNLNAVIFDKRGNGRQIAFVSYN